MGTRRLDKEGTERVLFQCWVPADLWDQLYHIALENDRTVAAEFVRRIRQSLSQEQSHAR